MKSLIYQEFFFFFNSNIKKLLNKSRNYNKHTQVVGTKMDKTKQSHFSYFIHTASSCNNCNITVKHVSCTKDPHGLLTNWKMCNAQTLINPNTLLVSYLIFVKVTTKDNWSVIAWRKVRSATTSFSFNCFWSQKSNHPRFST